MINSIDQPPVIMYGAYQSRKGKSENGGYEHGLGMKNIEEVDERVDVTLPDPSVIFL